MDATDRAPARDAGTHAQRTPNETQYKYKFGRRFHWNLRLGSRRGHTRGGSHSIRSSSPLHEGGAGGQSSHTLHRCVENKGRGVAKGVAKEGARLGRTREGCPSQRVFSTLLSNCSE